MPTHVSVYQLIINSTHSCVLVGASSDNFFSDNNGISASFSNRSAWFLNGTTSLCIIENTPTSLKTGARLSTYQVCNQFSRHPFVPGKTSL